MKHSLIAATFILTTCLTGCDDKEENQVNIDNLNKGMVERPVNIVEQATIDYSANFIKNKEYTDSIEITEAFWKSYSLEEDVSSFVSDSDIDNSFLTGLKPSFDSYTVLSESDDGVNVEFSAYCYEDIIVNTKVVDTDGIKKIDFFATLKEQLTSFENQPTIKKYCYGFEDQTLSGTLNGEPWYFVKSDIVTFDFIDGSEDFISLYDEDCNTEYYGECKRPKLIISQLDLDSEGGNFTNMENVTVYIPSNIDGEADLNLFILKGSYRITNTAPNTKKIEISFYNSNENNLDGYFYLEM